MARYERDYGRDFDRWGNRGSSFGGGRRDEGWGSQAWRSNPGEYGRHGSEWDTGEWGQGQRMGRNDHSYRGGYGHGDRYDVEGGYPGYGGGGFERGYGRSESDRGFQGGHRGGYGAGTGWDLERGSYAEPRWSGGSYDMGYGARGGYGSTRGWDSGYGGADFGYGGDWRERGWGNRGGSQGRSRASDIMTENPEAVTRDATIADVAKKMRDLDVGIIPVVDGEDNRRLRGVITDRDIAIRAVASGKDGQTKVEQCMTERVRSVNKNDSMNEVMRVMREEQVRRVPVTDRDGRLVGIIAQADLAVDFAGGDDHSRDHEVGETLERISEPASPERSGERMAASGRGQHGSHEDQHRSEDS